MDYNLIMENIQDGKYNGTFPLPKTKRLKVDTVIDENKSVKWNREEVERINNQWFAEIQAHRADNANKRAQFEKDLRKYLQNEGMNEKQALLIYDKAWDDGHAEGFYNVLEEAEELLSFVQNVMKED